MQQDQTTENVIDELISECKIYRFASELQTTEDETRKTALRNILAILQRCDSSVKKEQSDLTQKKLDNFFEKQDNFALKKSWTRLNDVQKIGRIKYYVSKMIMDTNKKQEYEKKLLELHSEKKIKKTQIVYDENLGEIVSIDVEI